MSLVLVSVALLAASAPAEAMKRRQGGNIMGKRNVIKYGSMSANGYLSVPLEETYINTCYEPTGEKIDQYEYEYEEVECEESCGYTSYSFNAYESMGSDYEEEKSISFDVAYENVCVNGGEGVWQNACVTVKVPPGTWDMPDEKTRIIKAEGVLKDCGYFDEEGTPPPTNPFFGKKMSVDVTIKCDKLERYNSECVGRNSGQSSFEKSRNVQMNADCYVEGPIGTLVIDGKELAFESASFGYYKSKDKTVTFERSKKKDKKE